MKLKLLSGCTLICMILAVNGLHAQQSNAPRSREKAEIKVPAKKFHLYLLAGQSNMAGRGTVEPEDTVGNPRILALNRDGVWEIAKDPIHFDKANPGVGPGLSFAREMVKQDKDIVIGLIPCAAGGSSIDHWLHDRFWEQTKSFPWNNAILRTRLAMKDGVLKGILWHQGESDSGPDKAVNYKVNLVQLVNKFRETFAIPNLPFVAGELGDYYKGAVNLNPVLHEAAGLIRYFAVVSGTGFTAIADGVHINSASQRIFGQRYAATMQKLVKN